MDQNVERRIRDRAYSIWEEEGRPAGRDVEHWLRAAQEVAAEVGAGGSSGEAAEKPKKPRAPRAAKAKDEAAAPEKRSADAGATAAPKGRKSKSA